MKKFTRDKKEVTSAPEKPQPEARELSLEQLDMIVGGGPQGGYILPGELAKRS